MTSIPIEKIPKFFNTQDKLEHFAAYFILGVLVKLNTVFQNKSELIRRNSITVSCIIITVYAMFDEIHQLIIPGRYCDFYDWLFDFIGGITGIILASHFLKRDESLVQ
jgi:VanZ family protein